MKNEFLRHIKKNKLFSDSHRLLLGVSGGKDSMALAQLLEDCGFTFSVVHCNFCLRGNEANEDEIFVKEHFEKKSIPVFATRFNTKEYASEKNLSIQMAARELRYNWFNTLCDTEGFDFILTAHHANDTIETFFINLLRGTGLNGLKGIPEKNGRVVRPLLFADREKIDTYISDKRIAFREDSSNREEKYLRNKLRHQLIPLLKEINPSLEITMQREMNILQQAQQLVQEIVQQRKNDYTHYAANTLLIELEKIKILPYRNLFLHEILNTYNFNADTILQLEAEMENPHTGKQFLSSTHVALIDRKHIIIKELNKSKQQEDILIDNIADIKTPLTLQMELKDGSHIINNKNTACLDARKVKFPLKLTKWKEGDSFYPLGMQQRKKLSDFFVSAKMSLFDKENQWILRSGNDIIWVIGHRIDDRFKVSNASEQTLILHVKE